MKLTEYQIKKITKVIPYKNNESVVLVDVMADKILGTEEYGVYRITKSYDIVWQVSESLPREPVGFQGIDPFCYLAESEEKEIITSRFSGLEYVIDPESGVAVIKSYYPR